MHNPPEQHEAHETTTRDPLSRRRLLGAAMVGAGLAAMPSTAAAQDPPVAEPDELNLRAFGAVGDGTTDDGPALQRALDRLAEVGGGTLFVPPGRYVIATPVSKNYAHLASAIHVRGVGSSSQLHLKTGPGTNAITFGSLN